MANRNEDAGFHQHNSLEGSARLVNETRCKTLTVLDRTQDRLHDLLAAAIDEVEQMRRVVNDDLLKTEARIQKHLAVAADLQSGGRRPQAA